MAGLPGIVIPVRVHPGSSSNRHVWMGEGLLHVWLTAKPVDGAANRALVKYLADQIGIAQGRIEISSGLSSRSKTLRIPVSAEQLRLRLHPDGSGRLDQW